MYKRYAKVESLHTLETLWALGENLLHSQPVTSTFLCNPIYMPQADVTSPKLITIQNDCISVRPKQIFYRNTENRNRPFGKTEIRPKPNILPKYSYFCRNGELSAETLLCLPKQDYFGQNR